MPTIKFDNEPSVRVDFNPNHSATGQFATKGVGGGPSMAQNAVENTNRTGLLKAGEKPFVHSNLGKGVGRIQEAMNGSAAKAATYATSDIVKNVAEGKTPKHVGIALLEERKKSAMGDLRDWVKNRNASGVAQAQARINAYNIGIERLSK